MPMNTESENFCTDPKILELRKKIQDETYINNAIDRIAVVISRQVVENRSSSMKLFENAVH